MTFGIIMWPIKNYAKPFDVEREMMKYIIAIQTWHAKNHLTIF